MTTSDCPNCNHPQHLPGTDCEAVVDHGPSRWHRCLCLARPGAARPCPPRMTCQGGVLGYADIWYLQHGHTLIGADGEISPEVLKVATVAVSLLGAAELEEKPDLNVTPLTGSALDADEQVGPADRSALIREAIDRLETRARQAPAPGAQLHSFRDVARVLIAELHDMAAEAQQPTPADACPLHSPTGSPCGCGHAGADDCHPKESR